MSIVCVPIEDTCGTQVLHSVLQRRGERHGPQEAHEISLLDWDGDDLLSHHAVECGRKVHEKCEGRLGGGLGRSKLCEHKVCGKIRAHVQPSTTLGLLKNDA